MEPAPAAHVTNLVAQAPGREQIFRSLFRRDVTIRREAHDGSDEFPATLSETRGRGRQLLRRESASARGFIQAIGVDAVRAKSFSCHGYSQFTFIFRRRPILCPWFKACTSKRADP